MCLVSLINYNFSSNNSLEITQMGNHQPLIIKWWEHDKPIKLQQALNVSNTTTSVDLCRCALQPGVLQKVSSFPSLSQLRLFHSKIGDIGANMIVRISLLTLLDLSKNQIRDNGVKYFGKLTKLHTLRLNWNEISDEGAYHLSKMLNLNALWIQSNKITDIGGISLSKLTKIQSLYLCRNKIGNEGASKLSRVRSLIHLDLYHTNTSSLWLKFISKILDKKKKKKS